MKFTIFAQCPEDTAEEEFFKESFETFGGATGYPRLCGIRGYGELEKPGCVIYGLMFKALLPSALELMHKCRGTNSSCFGWPDVI